LWRNAEAVKNVSVPLAVFGRESGQEALEVQRKRVREGNDEASRKESPTNENLYSDVLGLKAATKRGPILNGERMLCIIRSACSSGNPLVRKK
jgi:hypothetical protein